MCFANREAALDGRVEVLREYRQDEQRDAKRDEPGSEHRP